MFLSDGNSASFSRMDTTVRKKTRPLKLKKKMYEFYAAPITKYYCHSVSPEIFFFCMEGFLLALISCFPQIAYAVFLAAYTFISLVKTPKNPSWPELYVVACMFTFGCERLRTFLTTEPVEFMVKLWYVVF